MKKIHYIYRKLRNELFIIRAGIYFKYNISNILLKIENTQFLPYDEIKRIQIEYLKELIKNANLSWYENKLEKPFTIEIIFSKLIGISKSELRDEFDKIYSFSKKEFIHTSSGSTGLPLKVISSNISEAHRVAHRMRFYSWWGINPWDRNILVWGKMLTGQVKKTKVVRRLMNWIIPAREFVVNVFDLNEMTINEIYEQCVEQKAIFIRGYTSGLYQFCSLLRIKNLDGRKLGLKVAIVTSEILLGEQRDFIEEVLGCSVANEYGAAEIGLFACECPEGSMHICEELNLLQTHPDGRLLVTDLHNTSTPLFNYDIGDRIIISDKPCSCGRGLRVIEKIVGREGDLVKKPNGELISQYVFYYAAKEIAAMGYSGSIAQYKISQKGLHFNVFIVRGLDFKEESIGLFVDHIKQKIGKEITVTIEFVNEVPKEKTGKIRFFQRIDS